MGENSADIHMVLDIIEALDHATHFDDIRPVVARALTYREPGAFYDVDRLKGNLFSSHPLTFNLCGLLQRDLKLASRFMAELLPGLMQEVIQLLFEHSPGAARPPLHRRQHGL